MKKNVTILFATIAILALLSMLTVLHQRHNEVSEIYRHYKDRDDLRVGFVKDYRIDDSTAVDVTTLTAKDSAGWEALLREMNIKEGTIRKQTEAVKLGKTAVTEYYCMNNHPEQRINVKECSDFDLVIYSFNEYVTYIFDINTIEQGRRIQAHKNNEILK
ncbi:MAG: hypothetical protein K5918_04530 [Bacteroidales bacterium]|nr:hypothetical protein [Bacteroidales bacterium]